jgi:hypothetical protein
VVTDTRDETIESLGGALRAITVAEADRLADAQGRAESRMAEETIRGGTPAQFMGVLAPRLRIPEHALPELAAGAAAAAAGEVDHAASRGDAAEIAEDVRGRQALARRDAMMSALPENRLNCLPGLASLDSDQFPDKLQAWLNDPTQRTLVLAGGTGCGKTQAAYATAVQAARYGAKMMNRAGVGVDRLLVVRAWPVNRYLDELMPSGSPEPVWAVRHRAAWAELLILDDLGAELDDVATRFMRKELADLLDERIERRLRTIFTTNHGARVIEERLGERLWSRLQQQSTALKFVGPDRRAMTRLDW